MKASYLTLIFFSFLLLATNAISKELEIYNNFPDLNKELEKTVVTKEFFFNNTNEKINLTSFRDKIVILEFFLPWEISQSQSIYDLGKLVEVLKEQEVTDIIIVPVFISSTSNLENAKKSAERLMKESLAKIDTYFIDIKKVFYSSICADTKENTIPMSVIIDVNGKEVGRMTGSFASSIKKINYKNKSKMISAIRENSNLNN